MGADSARHEGEQTGQRLEQRRIMRHFRERLQEIREAKQAAFPYGEKYGELVNAHIEVVTLGARIMGMTDDAFDEWINRDDLWA